MVPSGRGTKVLKATKLTKVSEVGYKEEEPQSEGRGESREGEDLKRSNDEVHTEVRGRRKSTSSVRFTDGQSGDFFVYSAVLIYIMFVCTYVTRSTSRHWTSGPCTESRSCLVVIMTSLHCNDIFRSH